jgi:excisionase family DNA binding protein
MYQAKAIYVYGAGFMATEVAKVLGISRTRSYELVNEKGFPKIKIGTRIVVPKDEFKLWIQKQIKKG